MPTEIKIPAVGESITEVTIAKWLKKDGEAVKRDEVIAELESDKATFELPAEADGTLKILVAEGETIGIGTAIAQLDGAGASAALPARRLLLPQLQLTRFRRASKTRRPATRAATAARPPTAPATTPLPPVPPRRLLPALLPPVVAW
jgi:pyruvate/2-oxoglutarate dehydrogenase complex dihydrolipoamide acyltransferase (E2) component